MSTQPNKRFSLSYKGYLNPKTKLPRETILYQIGGVFAGMLVFFLLLFLEAGAVICASSAGIVSIGIFILLFRINNHCYSKDKSILEDLVMVNKVDSVGLLSAFFRDLQTAFEQSSIPYVGFADPSKIHIPDLLPLFKRVFREDSDSLYYGFKSQSGNFFKFVELLSPSHREILYRHYAKSVFQSEGF